VCATRSSTSSSDHFSQGICGSDVYATGLDGCSTAKLNTS